MVGFGTEWLSVDGALAESASSGSFNPYRDLRVFRELPTFRDEIFGLALMAICEIPQVGL